MSTARETILADIRHHLRNTEPKLRPHVIAPAGPPTDDLSGTFVTALEAVGGHVHRTPTL